MGQHREVLIVRRPPEGNGTAVSSVEGRKAVSRQAGEAHSQEAQVPLPAPQGSRVQPPPPCVQHRAAPPGGAAPPRAPSVPPDEAQAEVWPDESPGGSPGPQHLVGGLVFHWRLLARSGGSAGTAWGPHPEGFSLSVSPKAPAGPIKGAFASDLHCGDRGGARVPETHWD